MSEYLRIVVKENCTGCKTCDVACKQEHGLPVGLRWMQVTEDGPREIDGNMRLVYNHQDCQKYNQPPCQVACPAGLDAYGYVSLISQGKFSEALTIVRKSMPFAGVCGRVCTHPCELFCERNKIDGPMAIRWLKRFVADYELEYGKKKVLPVKRTKNDKVAIVGSGPAGLACAYDLIRKGYPVTVYESSPDAGGLLRYAIPEYRLPVRILDAEIAYIMGLGVQIITGTRISAVEELFEKGFKAVFLAIGIQETNKLNIDSENMEGVIDALTLLREVKCGGKPYLGSNVLVIGGGNSALDSARTALRLSSKNVQIVYRRSRDETPAMEDEIIEAEREGVKFNFMTLPSRILGNGGRVSALECIKTVLGEPDATGKRKPVPVQNSEFRLDADTIIVAIGQKTSLTAFPEIEKTREGTIKVNEFSLETNIRGVFAGGDAISGPLDVISAIAEGKDAAISIDRFLKGLDLSEGRLPTAQRSRISSRQKITSSINYNKMPVISPEERVNSFNEVALGFDEKTAMEEAKRCFSCGICFDRLNSGLKPACALSCSARCIHFDKFFY